jgi:hypothetical protein
MGTNTASPTFTVSPTVTPTLPGVGPGQVYSYPNPFVPGGGRVWRLRFDPSAQATVEVLDWAARRVFALEPAMIQASIGYASWDGRLRGGSMAAPGVYFVVVKTERGQRSATFTLVWP